MFDNSRIGKPGIGAAQVFRNEGVQAGVALDMGLIDDRFADVVAARNRRRRAGIVNDDGERDRRRIVGQVRLVVGFRRVWSIIGP